MLNYGMQGGWISPMTKVLKSDLSPSGVPLSDDEISWIGSTMSIAAVFGVPLYTYIADKFGRKTGIIAMAVPQAVSAWETFSTCIF
jgi:MFS family permease